MIRASDVIALKTLRPLDPSGAGDLGERENNRGHFLSWMKTESGLETPDLIKNLFTERLRYIVHWPAMIYPILINLLRSL